jgi:predicted house-cleaning noncanonical NTP pyrophosphatase (MazG superfamily)
MYKELAWLEVRAFYLSCHEKEEELQSVIDQINEIINSPDFDEEEMLNIDSMMKAKRGEVYNVDENGQRC